MTVLFHGAKRGALHTMSKMITNTTRLRRDDRDIERVLPCFEINARLSGHKTSPVSSRVWFQYRRIADVKYPPVLST
jgi:hypothetical protein